MSILNVNQIQPVGGGNTITVNASDVSASGATITATSFVGPVTSSSTSTFSSGINVTGGNVLIGTTDATIYNNGDSDSEGIVLRNGEVIDIARKGDLQLTLNRQTNDGPHIGFFRSGSPKTYISTRNDAFCIDTGGLNERLRIKSDGNVGINDTDPRTGLTIAKYGTAPTTNANTYSYPAGRWVSTWNTGTANNTDYWAGFGGSGYAVSSGSVNIALASNHNNTSQQAGMYIAGEATSVTSADFTIGKLVAGSATGSSDVAGNQRATKSELVRITSGGDLALGTNNPAGGATSGYDRVFNIQAGSSGALSSISFGDSNATGRIESVNGNNGRITVNASEYITFGTGGTPAERLRITSGGDVNITDGNLVVASGHGISFAATADGSGTNTSELLDDYETGNWTPVLKSGSNVITVTGSQNYYRYIKVGRLVTLFYCINNGTTSGTTGGTCTVGGLPFTPSSSTQNNRFMSGDVMFYNTGFKLSHWPVHVHHATGDGYVNFYHKAGPNDAYGGASINTVGSGSYFFWTFTYYTD